MIALRDLIPSSAGVMFALTASLASAMPFTPVVDEF